jgi:transcription initiation factor IIE alpha subunit
MHKTRKALDAQQLAEFECEGCGVLLKYDEGSFYCNEKLCGVRGKEVEIN